ncbi:anosmin-1-like [Syngnathoides biaculeatus]|uniref:anosmin-1-like n=1 Tax=Syngnathoides biaculeatus TaxID=300417 RepID=UPI002ADE3289|nr:anosmin-1-like [Syngnathoides biaculeatus]
MQAAMRAGEPHRVVLLLLLFGSGVCSKKLLPGFKSGEHDDGKDGASWLESFPRARCTSRCLSLHNGATPQNNGSLSWCHSHRECAKCLEPCRDSWSNERKSSCKEFCEKLFPLNHWECVASCEFLQTLLEVKQGGCPPPDQASGFAAACVDSCDRDTECPGQKKCCSNDCGHTCQSPQDLYKGVPLKPRNELNFEEVPPGLLEVSWFSKFNISAEPVVYILQTRWNFGIQPSDDAAVSWHMVAQTTEQRVRLYDIRPGRWYQFRVAAVNIHGTRGFTTPSRHIQSSRDPHHPPAPTELRATNITFVTGKAVRVQLQWHMIENLDIPVHHYMVRWTCAAIDQPVAYSLTKRRKLVIERKVVLDGLRSGRTYRVEVQAVSYWKQTQLKSPRAIVHFSTHLNTSATPKSSMADILHVGTPFYQNGRLQVHIYWHSSTDPSVEYYKIQWEPEYCEHRQNTFREKTSTKETFTSLQGLLFSCKYKVLLQPVSKTSRLPAKSICFITPSCSAMQAKSPKPLACNGETRTPQKVLMKPTNLTVSFKVHGGDLTAIFNWDVSAGPAQSHLTSYQVTLVEVTSTSRLSNEDFSQSPILTTTSNILAVSDLHPASVYRLEVRAITAHGQSPAISRTFQTPGLQHAFKHRKSIGKQDEEHY